MEIPHSPHSAPWGSYTWDFHGHCDSQRVQNKLRPIVSLPHSDQLPMRQRDAHQAARTKTKSTVMSSHTLPGRCLEDVHEWLFSLSVVHDQASRTCFMNRTRRFGLACTRCSAASRKFLHCELQLTFVFTEIDGAHRPRPVANSTSASSSVPYSSVVHTRRILTALLLLLNPMSDFMISMRQRSASTSHHSPPSAPGRCSLNILFRWIASCKSPISTLGPITPVVLTN